jgi:hypothetical protein
VLYRIGLLLFSFVAHIEKPTEFIGDAQNTSQLLEQITKWQNRHPVGLPDAHRRVWYRGHSDHTYVLWPGVYRDNFTQSSNRLYGKGVEEKRLNLEREMLAEFRTSGATLVNANAVVEVYFMAQHYGMPTRLLDWTTNPLAALFFAVKDLEESKDGELLVMDAPRLLPKEPDAPRGIMTMRHPYAVDAIGVSFWRQPKQPRKALILPIRPDNQSGRIGQQSSCFTLHMHEAEVCKNPTLERIKVPGNTKGSILDELRKLNIDEFTIYNDLDHLAKEIRRTWIIG